MRTKSRPPKPQPQHPQQHQPQHHPPTDIEEVKRRYMRQNRDLARQTNIQAQRIRILEGDVARLQAENLELRHQTQQAERAKWRVQAQTAGRVGDELSAKIGELYRIVCGLQDTQREAESRLAEATAADGERRRPMEGNWRERQTLSEIMQETLMPTIVEDKHYPRRSLDAGEINAIRLSDPGSGSSYSNESPDLGPPPVAHFDYEDPVKHASPLRNKSPPESTSVEEGEADELPESLTMNLETRRRRKDGPSKPADSRRHSLLPQSPAKADEGEHSPSSLRTGTKRKLADRDTEKSFKPPNEGDFTFTRKATPRESTNQESKMTECGTKSSIDSTTVSATIVNKPSRKILGDKSANMSPRKASATLKADEQKAEREKVSKPTAPVNAASARRRRVSFIPEPHAQKDSSEENETVSHTIDEVSLPSLPEQKPSQLLTITTTNNTALEAPRTSQPTTPAPPSEDFLSPIPSEPSSQQPRTLDPSGGRSGTPPPSNLLSALSSAAAAAASSAENGGAGTSAMGISSASAARPSRRSARGSAVNYAEPSLVAKMRRPDKKMVDALTGLQDPRRVMNAPFAALSSAEKEGRGRSFSRDGSVEVEVKVEEGEEGVESQGQRDEAWKTLPPASHIEPGSPLGAKGGSGAAAAAAGGSGAAQATQAQSHHLPVASLNETTLDDHPPVTAAPLSSASPRSLLPARSHHRRRHSAAQLPQPSALDERASDGARKFDPVPDKDETAATEAAAKRLEELELYDFRDSSPPPSRSSDPLEAIYGSSTSTLSVPARGPKKSDGPALASDKREKKVIKREAKTETTGKTAANPAATATSGAAMSAQQRRHSTLPSKSSSASASSSEQVVAAGSRGKSGHVDGDAGAGVATGKVKSLGGAGSRRRSMML